MEIKRSYSGLIAIVMPHTKPIQHDAQIRVELHDYMMLFIDKNGKNGTLERRMDDDSGKDEQSQKKMMNIIIMICQFVLFEHARALPVVEASAAAGAVLRTRNNHRQTLTNDDDDVDDIQ